MDYYLTTRDEVAGVGGSPAIKKISQINFPVNSFTGTSQTAIAVGDGLLLDPADGKLVPFSMSGAATMPFAGFALNSAAMPDEDVRVGHGFVNVFSGLTAGNQFRIGDAGGFMGVIDPDYYYINADSYEIGAIMSPTMVKTFDKLSDFNNTPIGQTELDAVLANYSTEAGYTNLYYGDVFNPTPTGINGRGFGQTYFTQPVETYLFRVFYFDNNDNWQVLLKKVVADEVAGILSEVDIYDTSRATLANDFWASFVIGYSAAGQYDPAYITSTLNYNPAEPTMVKYVVQYKRL